MINTNNWTEKEKKKLRSKSSQERVLAWNQIPPATISENDENQVGDFKFWPKFGFDVDQW